MMTKAPAGYDMRRLMAVSRLFVGIILLFLAGVAHAGDIGTIKGTVTENGSPVKAKIHILRDGFSGAPQVYETVAGAVTTPHFLFGVAITFPLTAPGVYSVSTNKKNGAFLHAGLPGGIYTVAVEVGERLVEQATGVVVSHWQPTELNFDISAQHQESASRPTTASDQERASDRTNCAVIYRNTAEKKLGDLTVKEEQQVRACQVAGLYPPP
jgi:hypothetical protein